MMYGFIAGVEIGIKLLIRLITRFLQYRHNIIYRLFKLIHHSLASTSIKLVLILLFAERHANLDVT